MTKSEYQDHQIVAEAVTGLDRKIEALRSEMLAGFRDLRELIQASHLSLDRRVTRLEEGRRRWGSRDRRNRVRY